MVRSGFSRNPKSLTLCGSSRSIKIATRAPASGLNTVFNRRERLNGGNVSGTISFVLAIIDLEVRSRTGVSQRKYLPYVTELVTDVGGNVSAYRRVARLKHVPARMRVGLCVWKTRLPCVWRVGLRSRATGVART